MKKKKMTMKKLPEYICKKMQGTAYGEDNYEYGLPHVWRVEENIELILSSSEIDTKMGLMLRVAGYLYDSQRGNAKYVNNHAAAAVKLLNHLEIKGLDDDDMQCIRDAILRHSSELSGLNSDRAETRQGVLLWLLVLADRMDAVGIVDLYRAVLLSQKITNRIGVFSKVPSSKFKQLFEGGVFCQEIEKQKFESYADHLLCNYLSIGHVCVPIEHLLNEECKEEITKRKLKMRLLIEETIELQEQNEKFKASWSVYKKRLDGAD